MNPKIIDEDTGVELWTASQCAEKANTSRGTFTSYAGRGKAPKPVAKLHGLTLWRSDEVLQWQETRNHR